MAFIPLQRHQMKSNSIQRPGSGARSRGCLSACLCGSNCVMSSAGLQKREANAWSQAWLAFKVENRHQAHFCHQGGGMFVGEGTRKTDPRSTPYHGGLTNEAIPTGRPLFPASLLAARLVCKWTKPSRLRTLAHASRVSRRPEGILSLAYGCHRVALRGRGSYQLPVWTKQITDHGVRHAHDCIPTKACRSWKVSWSWGGRPAELFWKHVTHTTQRRQCPTLPSLPRYLGVIVRSARLTRRPCCFSSYSHMQL